MANTVEILMEVVLYVKTVVEFANEVVELTQAVVSSSCRCTANGEEYTKGNKQIDNEGVLPIILKVLND